MVFVSSVPKKFIDILPPLATTFLRGDAERILLQSIFSNKCLHRFPLLFSFSYDGGVGTFAKCTHVFEYLYVHLV